MKTILLQAVTAEKFTADTLQARAGQTMELIKNTETSELFSSLMDQAVNFGLKVLAALAIYIIGGWVIRRVRKMVSRGFERKGAETALASFVNSLVGISMWVILIIITVSTLGINTTSLAALLAAGGMAIGMALSGTVQNFAGGIILLVFKPFKAGDFIEAQGFMGTVSELNISSTKIITPDNRVVILPNGALANGSINNYSANAVRRVDWEISLAYGTDTAAVKQMLQELMRSDSRILDASTPGAADPFVALRSMGDHNIQFVCRAWVHTPDYWDVFFSFNEAAYEAIPKKDFHFVYPQLDVHIKQ